MIVETCRGDDAQSSTDDEGSSSKQHSPERTKTTRNCRRKARRSDETSDNDFFFTMQYNLLITKSALRNVLRTGKRDWETTCSTCSELRILKSFLARLKTVHLTHQNGKVMHGRYERPTRTEFSLIMTVITNVLYGDVVSLQDDKIIKDDERRRPLLCIDDVRY